MKPKKSKPKYPQNHVNNLKKPKNQSVQENVRAVVVVTAAAVVGDSPGHFGFLGFFGYSQGFFGIWACSSLVSLVFLVFLKVFWVFASM